MLSEKGRQLQIDAAGIPEKLGAGLKSGTLNREGLIDLKIKLQQVTDSLLH